MKQPFACLVFALLVAVMSSCTSAYNKEATIKKEAEAMMKAQIDRDFDTFVKYMCPRVVEKKGGMETAIAAEKKATARSEAQGYSINKFTVGTSAKPVKAGLWLTSLVPVHSVSKAPSGHADVDSTLLAMSEDEGKTWGFLDLSTYTQDELNKLFPELEGKITVTEQKPPIYTHDINSVITD